MDHHRLPHKSPVYDLAALILFGTSAIPIRLKVLLDALFAQSSDADVARLLRRLGWTEEDFSRGYMLKVSLRSRRLSPSQWLSQESQPY